MNKNILAALVVVVALVGGAAYLYLSKTEPGSVPPPGSDVVTPPAIPPASKDGNLVEVAIQNYAYSSKVLKIKKGTKVVWTNKDSAAHTVSDVNDVFDSDLMKQNESWDYTFNTPGTYNYYCKPHPNMKASIEVTN